MKKIIALGCLSAMAISPQLKADGFNYNYVTAAYNTADTNVNGINFDSKGFSVRGSFALGENIALTAGYAEDTADTTDIIGVDIDTNSVDFGFDLHAPIATTTDLIIGFSILKAEVSIPFASDKDTGNVIGLGLRHQLAPRVELMANISRVDVFDDASTGFGASLLIEIVNDFHVGFGYGSADDTDVVSFGIRAGF